MTTVLHSRHPLAPFLAVLALLVLGAAALPSIQDANPEEPAAEEAKVIEVEFLEVVTPKVKETCALLAATHGVEFGEPVPMFGNARTAALEGGGRISVRAPMRDDEAPVVRPYLLVEDIEAAVKAAKAAGAEVAMNPMEIPNEGTFAIYLLGGIQHGLWQN